MHLLDLPNEILMLLPHHFRNIIDLNDAASSCKRLHTLFAQTSPKTILRLAAASSREYFCPDPYFLIAATVRQVSDWARLNPLNTITLRRCLENGIEALLDLCISKAALTLDDVRHLHAMRSRTIDPLIEMLNRCAGAQWFSTANFWEGSASDACEPQRALFQLVIYGELFACAFEEVLNPVGPTASPPCFDLETRLDYWRCCVPGYGHRRESIESGKRSAQDPSHELRGLKTVLYSRTWEEAWEKVRRESGPDFEEGWRQELWASGVQLQGLQGLEMLRPGGSAKWRASLEEMRLKIETLDVKYMPKRHTITTFSGSNRLLGSEAPMMAKEVLRVHREGFSSM